MLKTVSWVPKLSRKFDWRGFLDFEFLERFVIYNTIVFVFSLDFFLWFMEKSAISIRFYDE